MAPEADRNKQDFELELELEFRSIKSRDWQLWSLGILVLFVVAVGFLSLIASGAEGMRSLLGNSRFLPQLFSGFVALIVLFNLYIVDQKRRLNATRDRLLRKMLRDRRGENAFLLDPLTNLFNAHYFEQAVTREVSRSERHEHSLSFAILDLQNLQTLRSKYGDVAREHLLTAMAELLRSNLRGSDTICRTGAERFIIILPDTDQRQAAVPMARLLSAVANWNNTTNFAYKLQVEIGIAPFRSGKDWKEQLKHPLKFEAPPTYSLPLQAYRA
jgi:diguanylate cyclase (GGDEF)-like protein